MATLLYSMLPWGVYGPPWDFIARLLRGELPQGLLSAFWSYLEYFQIGVEV
jgi:hypothetical protein